MFLKLLRLTDNGDATKGVLLFDNNPLLCTLELPWKDNEKKISCIPEGHYVCKRTLLRKTTGGLVIPVTYEVQDVPNRDGILFHVGNSTKDTNGCILVAKSFGPGDTILESRIGFDAFIVMTEDLEEFNLEVIKV